jgi:hypothetical protein
MVMPYHQNTEKIIIFWLLINSLKI